MTANNESQAHHDDVGLPDDKASNSNVNDNDNESQAHHDDDGLPRDKDENYK